MGDWKKYMDTRVELMNFATKMKNQNQEVRKACCLFTKD
jgi:hypothetical protein